MIDVRIEEKPAFQIAGRKIWISEQDNELFGEFWDQSSKDGLLGKLQSLSNNEPGKITNSHVFGVSCVDEDPSNRAFDFYIATEIDDINKAGGLEQRLVPACRWVIFSNRGALPSSLIEAEMYALMEWLPQSGYKHANAPEIEVYPAHDSSVVEFWLPISPLA